LRFSEAEMARRYALTLELIDRLELDALVIYGNSGVNRHNHANHFWLSQWQDMHHCYLVVPREGEMTLLVGLVNHVPNARELTDLPNVEWGGYEPGKTIAKLVSGRLGLVGVNATWSDGMPYRHYEDVKASSPEVVDVTREYAALRRIKSDEEVARLRGAAELSDLAITTLVDVAKPGLSETELVARVEESYRRRGGTTRITFLRSMPMDAPNGCLPAQYPSSRRLE
jgi:Xaa-Pro dipeptidase